MTDASPQPALDRLVRRLSLLIGTATRQLERDPGQVAQWEEEVSRQLARYHSAAYLAGAKVEALSPAARTAVQRDLRTQLDFLSQFALEIQEADAWKSGWNSRAESYAKSIKIPFNRGVTKMLPLPAMPAQGTQCMGNCGCLWEIITVNEENNDYDAYWRRNKNDSCQTCLEREADWSPVQIRSGELQ